MVRASVSLQLHGRTRRGQKIGKKGVEKRGERENGWRYNPLCLNPLFISAPFAQSIYGP